MHVKEVLLPLLFTFVIMFAVCEAETGQRSEEAAIRKKAEAYENAFNHGDAKALAALWAEDAEYVDPDTGEVLQGREEIEEEFRTSFEENGKAQIKITIDSITFQQPDRAIETGTAVVSRPGEEPDQTAYRAYYEKQFGDWLLTQVREVEFEAPPTQYEHLKELEWLVGEWLDEDEDTKIETKIAWDKYQNFLTQRFTVTVEGQLELEGMQIIGWDPVRETIRSWVFDSDGGFGEGTWRKEGKSWVVEAAQTLADGRRGSAINIYTPLGEDSYSWESTGREVGGQLLPNIDPVTVKREKGKG